MPSIKKISFAIIPATVLSITLLAIFEWRLRQSIYSWDPNGQDAGPRAHAGCYQPAPTTGYEPIPNKCKRDDLGFYRTWKGPKPDDAFHVLVLGDSIADQHEWVVDTMSSMNKITVNSPRIIASNAGTPGYDTCSELRVLEERGLQVNPDLVLLQYCPNDLAVTATVIPTNEDRVRFYVGWEYTEFPKWILRSRALTYIMLKNLQFNRTESKMRASQTPVSACLKQFKKLSESEGFSLHVAAFPVFVDDLESPEAVVEMQEGEYTAQQAESRGRELLTELDIPFTEIRDLFEGHSLVARRNHPTDLWHPDRKGQTLIGNKLGPILVERHIQP